MYLNFILIQLKLICLYLYYAYLVHIFLLYGKSSLRVFGRL